MATACSRRGDHWCCCAQRTISGSMRRLQRGDLRGDFAGTHQTAQQLGLTRTTARGFRVWQLSEEHRLALERQAEEHHRDHNRSDRCTAATRARPRDLRSRIHPTTPNLVRIYHARDRFSAPWQTQRTMAEPYSSAMHWNRSRVCVLWEPPMRE